MKRKLKKSLLLGIGLGALSLAACGEDEVKPDPVDPIVDPPVVTGPIAQTIEVNAPIKGDTTWEGQNTYVLKSHIFVESGTLTIQPGAKILGDQGSSLVVTREAKLDAVGTAEKPIVFTSSRPVGERRSTNWGGVVLLGKATLNVGEQSIEGFVAGADSRTLYGGSDDSHDCGKLQYARIEFAGFKLLNNSELNGLTLGACGNKTVLDYIQVHRGADDGIEFFGGTANLKHALVTLAEDDGLDWDFGYSGRVQFLVIQQGENLGNVGFESDNNEKSNDALPRSSPTLYNATLVGRPSGGTEKSSAMHLRRGTAGSLNNLVVMGFNDGAINVDGTSTVAQYTAGALSLKSSLFWSMLGSNTQLPVESATDDGKDGNFLEHEELVAAATGNTFADPMLAAATSTDAPSFLPQAGSPALSGGLTPPADGFFDTSATFKGAMGTVDWTAGWTAFPKS